MICYAKNEDLSQILSLWNECFPGEKEFTEYFFENLYDKDNTLVFKNERGIVAMLQMLPFESSKGMVTYIYGVATSEIERKKGYAEKLMKKSFEISEKRGHKYSILIPAEEWLFDFYKKYGYEAKFYYKKEQVINKNNENISQKLQYHDIEQVISIYNSFDKGEFFIKRDEEYFKHQINLYGDGALKYIENDEIIGYSFGYTKQNQYFIDEIFSFDIEKCLKSFNDVIYKTCGQDIKIGVVKSLCNEKEPSGYLNLMYN